MIRHGVECPETLMEILMATAPVAPVFKVTDGVVQAASLVEHPQMRMETTSPCPLTVSLLWSYLGLTKDLIPLSDGTARTQIGMKLHSVNQCNLIYVMRWQIPSSKIVIQIKSNPGKSTYEQCGANGYTTLFEKTVPPSVNNILQATFDGPNLHVFEGGAEIGKVVLPPTALVLSGGYGVRSDNGRFFFQLR